jgi:hypothetical protein
VINRRAVHLVTTTRFIVTRVHPLLFLLAVVAAVPEVRGQGLVTPVAHWGGITLPEREPSTIRTFHVAAFTQFGKETTATGAYVFRPYNDISETLGFNILSETKTRYLNAAGLAGSSLSMRQTRFVGVIDDRLPRFFQNRVLHLGNLSRHKLLPVPRKVGDTPDDVSLGPTKSVPIAGFSREYFLRMYFNQERNGYEERVLSPFFLGGGYGVGTLNQELFIHLGSDIHETTLPRQLQLRGFLRAIGVGGMVRSGVLVPGPLMRDLTAEYLNAQGVVRVVLDLKNYPVRLDWGVTAARGYFAAPRSPEQRAEIEDFGPNSADAKHYQTKTPLTERFATFRVTMGNLAFETYNDSFGGKDKGPSYGAQVSFRFAPKDYVLRDQ